MLLGLSVVVLAAAHAQPAPSGQRTNILFGFLLPPNEPQPLDLKQGVLLAVEKANEQPGAAVHVVFRGAVGQWGTDAVEAGRMATDDEADALLAPPSGAATHLALQVAGRTGVPVITLCPDSSVTRTGVRWMARVTPGTVEEAIALFSHFGGPARENPIHSWLALVPAGRTGREIGRDLSRAAELSGVSRPRTVEVSGTSVDARMVFNLSLSNQVKGILLWLPPTLAGSVTNALRESEFSGVLAGPGWLRGQDFLAAAGKAGEQCLTAVPVLSAGDELRLQQFAQAYRMRFGCRPSMSAAFSYDAACLIVQLLRTLESGPARRAFPIQFELPAVTGVLRFDTAGNRKVRLQIRTVGPDPLSWSHDNLGSSVDPKLSADAGVARGTARP